MTTPAISTEKKRKVEPSTSSLIADHASAKYSSREKAEIKSIYEGEDKKQEETANVKKDLSTLITDEIPHKEADKEKDKLQEIDEETKQKLVEEFIKQGNKPLVFAEVEKRSTKRKGRSSVTLAGNSAITSSQYNNPMPNTLRTSVSETYGSYTLGKMQAFNEEEVIKPESRTTHNQPVSFGLLASYAFTPKFQIETGVVYTYLSSETKNKSADFQSSEKVQFHYLGVPLNLNYTVASFNKLNLFVTAGAMIEKDFDGKIKYYDEKKTGSLEGGYSLNSSTKIKQQKPQFSVTGGVGLTYPIYDKASLFGKIGGRYYFDTNNEYKTYYSDEKFGLDIQLGIKFNF